MAVYFVTGKLGSGKSLAAIHRIKEYLIKGSKVATNLDLNLDKLLGEQSKNCVAFRVPDQPTVEDFHAIGKGNESYDESKNGLLVLDECGTWFNSRNWNDKTRKAVIDWLLHARKLGWDIIFIVQDISIVDKQARLALCEHLVVCRRADKFFKIPLLETLFKITTFKMPKPQLHVAVVKYGDTPTSPFVDRWWYRGTDLYEAYDTKQIFSPNYSESVYSFVPPWFTHGRYRVKKTGDYYMRLTKIYWKRFNTPLLAGFGFFCGALIVAFMQPAPVQEVIYSFPEAEPEKQIEQLKDSVSSSYIPVLPESIVENNYLDGYKITGVAADKNGNLLYMSITNNETTYNLQSLISDGYSVNVIDNCAILVSKDDYKKMLHTEYCPSNEPSKSLNDFYSKQIAFASKPLKDDVF
jgi:hypothetical protein